MHFGGFASNYLRREYFFDVHPPLGKLLIAGAGYLFGFDGSFSFDMIGRSYITTSAPYVALRTLMVVLGVGSIALSYASLMEMGLSVTSAGLAAGLQGFDNALTVQSRFILLDSILIFFISGAVYAWIRFRQQRSRPFAPQWWLWLCLTGASIGAATSVKMVGLFTVGAIGVATVVDLWELADWRRRNSDATFKKHFLCRALALIALPVLIYVATFYVHFTVLTKTGPGDEYMSAEFQAMLEGNELHGKSRLVYYGHTMRLKSRVEDIYLHSHPHKYPREHEDGKISSEGQQVTGYPAADANNLWQILHATADRPSVPGEKIAIKNGDEVRLRHVGTGRLLITHDVASPLTKTNMEVTMVDEDTGEGQDGDEDEGRANEEKRREWSVWIVDIKTGGDTLKAHSCQFRLKSRAHGVFLTNWQQALPKWGFHQREVNGDKRGVAEGCKWVVSEVVDEMGEEERRMTEGRPRPRLSFLQKFVELQYAQLDRNAAMIDDHPFKSSPISWPFVVRGISYWDRDSMARIYLLGNPVAWMVCVVGVMAGAAVAGRELFLIQRGHKLHGGPGCEEQKFLRRMAFLLMFWALHYLPFFTMSRTLYLHHYLPAYIMSAMATGTIVDYALHRRRHSAIAYAIVAAVGVATVAAFLYFAPITYGTRIPTAALEGRKWLQSWDWP